MGTPCPAAINEGRKLASSSIDRRAFFQSEVAGTGGRHTCLRRMTV
jgi:hypothetical protein